MNYALDAIDIAGGCLPTEREDKTNVIFKEVGEEPDDTFLDRMEIEISELHDKYNKLDAFITGDKFASLPRVDRELLIRQHKAMEDYYFILQDRIELAKQK